MHPILIVFLIIWGFYSWIGMSMYERWMPPAKKVRMTIPEKFAYIHTTPVFFPEKIPKLIVIEILSLWSWKK